MSTCTDRYVTNTIHTFFQRFTMIINKKDIDRYLAQAISWITDPNRRNVQLKAKPTFLQCFPRSPSRTSNHCIYNILVKFSKPSLNLNGVN